MPLWARKERYLLWVDARQRSVPATVCDAVHVAVLLTPYSSSLVKKNEGSSAGHIEKVCWHGAKGGPYVVQVGDNGCELRCTSALLVTIADE